MADFGIVRNPAGLTTAQLTHDGRLTGTKGWAAPEQHKEAHEATITADVFGLGAIASWMLTGTEPSYGWVALPADPRIRAVIRRATNSNPADRYSNLDNFLVEFRRATRAQTGTLESLIEERDWTGLSAYILGQPSQHSRIVRELPRMGQDDVNAWADADRVGLVDTVCDLIVDLGTLQYEVIDAFLSWGVKVLRALVNDGELESAERVATALFGATAGIGQFAPARTALDWLAVVSLPAQQSMESALHQSFVWEFFQGQALDRFEEYSDNELIRRLRES